MVDTVEIGNASLAPVEALATVLGADERWYAASVGGEGVRYWDVQAGPRSCPVLRPARLASLHSVVLSQSGGDQIVTALGSPDQMWRWRAVTGQLLGSAPTTSNYHNWWAQGPTSVPVAAVDVDGASMIVTGMADGSLRGWDPLTGANVGPVWDGQGVQTWSIAGAVLEDDTPLVLSGGADGLVHRWDARTGTRYGPALERCGYAMAMTTVRLPDGRTVVCVASGRGRVHRRDVATGRSVGPPIRTGWQGDPKYQRLCPIRMTCLATPTGGVVATCVDYRTVDLWDLVTGEHLGDLPRHGLIEALTCAWMPDGIPVVLIGDNDGNVRRFHALAGTLLGDVFHPHGCTADRVSPVSVDGERLVLVVHSRSGLRRYDGRTGEPVGNPHRPSPLFGLGVTGANLPDGRGILIAAIEQGIARLDLDTGAIHDPTPDEQPDTIWDVATAPLPDGRVVIAGAGHDGKVYRWDAATGQAIGEPLLGHRISVKAITTASGPDGTTMIVSGCEAGEVRRWDAATGLPIGGPLPGEVGMVGDLAVIDCRGYKLLVCVDFDGGLHRWNLYTGEPVGTTVAIPRGTWLIATDVDGDGDGDVDGDGIPTVFLGVRDDAKASRPVVRWRLDDGTRVDDSLPDTLRAVYRDHGQLRLVLAGDDGSVTVVPA